MHAVIQVPAFREPELDHTLTGISQQYPPEGWRVSYEAWVTPTGAKTNCGTWKQAEDHPVFSVHEAPSGKLNARNTAHKHAVAEADADVIVSWDGDAPPVDEHTLQTLLDPLTREDVVAANGRPVFPKSVFGILVDTASTIDRTIRKPLYGRLSAFTSTAWQAAGPFDTSVDQTDVYSIRREEEFRYRRRLSKIGSVADTPAGVHASLRRPACHLEKAFNQAFDTPESEWCRRRGEETFNTRQDPD